MQILTFRAPSILPQKKIRGKRQKWKLPPITLKTISSKKDKKLKKHLQSFFSLIIGLHQKIKPEFKNILV
jgi:hypothetical protein